MVITIKKTLDSQDGILIPAVYQVGDGSIITKFDKTPTPQKPTDVVCPHFMELKWAYGCPFNCAWCYLKGTFRFQPRGAKPVFKDYEKIKSHVERFFQGEQKPEILNTGELADSLMGEGLSLPFSKFIIPIFETQSNHKVLFLTKSTNIKNLLETQTHHRVIVSFSLNSEEVAEKWEKGAPSVSDRIHSAKELYETGFEIRIRIDPMVPVANWENEYNKLIENIFVNLKPSRITIGSLRGLQSTINNCTDKSWVQYLQETSNWGRKVKFQVRFEMYSKIIDRLIQQYRYTDIALCKETLKMWSELGLDYTKIKCNCIW